jgi:hypothetical protein
MSTLVECPGCGKRYKVGDNLAGQRVRCGCGKTLIVPTANPAGDSPGSQQQVAADDIPDDLLDETIWDTEPKIEPPVETTEAEADLETSPVAQLAPAAPALAENHPRPTAIDDTKDEPETFWDRVKSPSRQLIAWLAMGYGAAMTFLLLALTALTGLGYYRVFGLALAVLIAVGGVLIRKRHPLGPSCAGLASVGTCFSWLFSLLLAFLPIHIFLAIFVVQFVFIYSAPAYIIYWCLKEEEAVDKAARRDDFYAIRDSLKDRMTEENQKEWESK